MSRRAVAWAVVLVVPLTVSWACTQRSATPDTSEGHPATVERLAGTDLSRVILTARAAERLAIETTPVREAQVSRRGVGSSVAVVPATSGRSPETTGGERRKVVPHAAVLYDPRGESWVYTNPEPLVFIRHRIVVDYIDGDWAVLLDGPPVGTTVVTVGAAQLLGAELEIGH